MVQSKAEKQYCLEMRRNYWLTEKKSACWSVVLTADQSGIVKAVGEEVYLAESWAKLMAKQWVVSVVGSSLGSVRRC